MTKKRLVSITVILAVIYSGLLMFLPDSVVGTRRYDGIAMFTSKICFLGISVAITTAFILIFLFKREFIRGQIVSFNRFKYLLALLVKRDFVSRYRKSVLGVLWSLLNPLLTMLVMTAVFSYLFRFQIENYPAYLLSGQIIFNFFSESTTLAMNSVIVGEGIIKKVYVPKYIFPLSKVLSSLVNLGFSVVALLIVFVATGVTLKMTMLLTPIPIIYTFVFSLGIAMMLSAMAVFFRDLTYLYGVMTMLIMYLTPIIYPVDILPEQAVPFFGLNPLYHFVDYFRCLTLYGTVPGLWANIVCLGFSAAALCFGVYVFMSKQDKYILSL